ncbi:hypothetical protein HBH81_094080 [Parastagonospora nodorum]|nr:hypothetical protein HBH81_094080 [Parastagonospora nodorum]
MEAVRTESYVKMSSIFKRRSRAYPGVQTCLGSFIGISNERHWWYATGKAREDFEAVEAYVQEQLEADMKDSYRSTVYFKLFMIGRDEISAKPTIMFFCEEKEPRERAKKVLDKRGLLLRLPGFRTGHQSEQPITGPLVQPADVSENKDLSPERVDHLTEAYYDPQGSVGALGMAIFAKHRNGRWRKATAYRVYQGEKCFLMSVSHIFVEQTLSDRDGTLDNDGDYDFGSDCSSDTGEQVQPIQTVNTSKTMMDVRDSEQHDSSRSPSLNSNTQNGPKDESNQFFITKNEDGSAFKPLGVLLKLSADQDWVLIDVRDDFVAIRLETDISISKNLSVASMTGSVREVKYWTTLRADGIQIGFRGTLSESRTYMRLPGSLTFRTVYHVDLEEPINWGDCGGLVCDVETGSLYGHVVASSGDMRRAYIIPSRDVFNSSGTMWHPSAPTPLSPSAPEQMRSGYGTMPSAPLMMPQKPNSTAKYSSWPRHVLGVETLKSEEASFESILPKGQEPYAEHAIMLGEQDGTQSQERLSHDSEMSYSFRFDEFTNIPEYLGKRGKNELWEPSAVSGDNIRIPGSLPDQWWSFTGGQIQPVERWDISKEVKPYKTVSMMYLEGFGFCIMEADATMPRPHEVWHPLSFEWKIDTMASLLKIKGTEPRLFTKSNAQWVKMLLPAMYHGFIEPNIGDHGGLSGDLGIFLALLAFSIKPDSLLTVLPKLMVNGEWQVHTEAHGRIDRRGVIVQIYTTTSHWSDLTEMEKGQRDMYYR